MAILSKRIMGIVARDCRKQYGIKPVFLDASGRMQGTREDDPVCVLTCGKRILALEESANQGEAYIFSPVNGVKVWILALEHRRIFLGGAVGGVIRDNEGIDTLERLVELLVSGGVETGVAEEYGRNLPVWDEAGIKRAVEYIEKKFYAVSGWEPILFEEHRLRSRQREQLHVALEEGRRRGVNSLYEFEKERTLLANIRAGDRSEARRILNEMLAGIYLSSQKLPVLRARTIEMMSCITRAAIEDNPLLEPLIVRNHGWTERLVRAASFEELSRELMDSLDEFIEGIYLHRTNRANEKVTRALNFLSQRHAGHVTLSEVGREVGLSSYRIAHLIKEHTGRSMLENLYEIRIRQAQQLLDRTNKTCADIAYETGFGDQSYFTARFRRITGMTPAKYRARGRSATP